MTGIIPGCREQTNFTMLEHLMRGITILCMLSESRAVPRALIGGGVYSYIRVMPDGFLLKSVVFKLISKEISRQNTNI